MDVLILECWSSILVKNCENPGAKQTQPSLQHDSANKYLVLITWLVRVNMLRCSGNRNLFYTDEHKISPCSIQAKKSTQQQFLQVLSCTISVSFEFLIKKKQNVYIRHVPLRRVHWSPTIKSCELYCYGMIQWKRNMWSVLGNKRCFKILGLPVTKQTLLNRPNRQAIKKRVIRWNSLHTLSAEFLHRKKLKCLALAIRNYFR
jgi:hypothetical protein